MRQACVGDGPPDFQGSFLWRGRLPTAQALPLGVREGMEAAHMGGQLLAVTWVVGPTTCWVLGCPGERWPGSLFSVFISLPPYMCTYT